MHTNGDELSTFHLDATGVMRTDALSCIPRLVHGFGTRHAQGWPVLPSATAKQIHSDRVLVATAPGVHGEADALITNSPGLLVAVRTADCVPILIADPAHHALAAIHAGWRGSVSRIAVKALETMARQFGTRPADVFVAIGPAIGLCCFEVGPEVAAEFVPLFPERDDLHSKTHIDLPEANRRQFIDTGVNPDRIASAALCTRCDARRFHSFRRDKDQSGRMVAAIGWSAEA